MKVNQAEKPQLANNITDRKKKKPKKTLKRLLIKSLTRIAMMYSINNGKLSTKRTTESIKPENPIIFPNPKFRLQKQNRESW